MIKLKRFYKNDKVCYFCGSNYLVNSRMRRTIEFNQIRVFLLCLKCKGFCLYPKLEQFEIDSLYSPSYIDSVSNHLEDTPKEEMDRFINLFAAIHRFADRTELNFLDYGCGSEAEVIIRMSSLGIQSFGLEIEENARSIAQLKSRSKIFSPKELAKSKMQFDVIFLGDVLEHLNDPKGTLDDIFSVLSPGGLLIAQGPLEGAITISNFFLSIKSFFTRHSLSQFPPYHTSLASRKSILALFHEANFKVHKLNISEPVWPAARFGTLDSFKSISSFTFSVTKLLDTFLGRSFNKFGTRFYLEATKMP